MTTKHDLLRERVAADTEAFLAAGGEIQQIPIGESGEKDLKRPAQRGQHKNTRMWVKGEKVRYTL